jgi:hypothetical protein
MNTNWKVRVRMYRQWLGDCFLLSFCHGEQESHIMIDCGALTGTPDAKKKLTAAVESIAEETGGQLAALVVTHEHWDHVSGFFDAFDSFKKFKIGEVWSAWTENPNQTIAKARKKREELHLQALQSALGCWNASGSDEDQERGAAVSQLLGFAGFEGLAAYSMRTAEAMSNALSMAPKRLLNPGDTVQPVQIPGVRVHVLAPPKETKALHDLMGKVGQDIYGLSFGPSVMATAQAFAAAADRELGYSGVDHYLPFEEYLNCDREKWEAAFGGLATSYNSNSSRRIDRDWLDGAAEFALQLDSYTNNTSLVLAFELVETGQVLLFVGDAQIGNWKSWAAVKFEDEKVTATNLLARTVFYKVGHHGSHNATLKEGGLELMTSPDLVAAIPVDEIFAHRPKGGKPEGWDMPAGPLLKVLLEKTSGRVLRGDSDFPKKGAKPDDLGDKEWADFQDDTDVQPLYIDYFLR